MSRPTSNGSKESAANLGFDAKLWLVADKLRNNLDAAIVLPPSASIVEDDALTGSGSWVTPTSSGRTSRPANQRRNANCSATWCWWGVFARRSSG